MGSLGFQLTEDEVNLLAMKYCDLGNKFEMNYWDFCDTCDPKPVWMDQAVKDRSVDLKPDKTYFRRSYNSAQRGIRDRAPELGIVFVVSSDTTKELILS